MTPRAIAYLRCSTDRQAESGLGLEAQREHVTSCAARLGLPVANVFVDAGTSGSLAIEDRPVLLEAVASLKRGDMLIVAKRDRIGRDVIAVAMIERLVSKRGCRIVSAAGEGTDSGEDPAGMLTRRLIDSVAEYERLIIAARTRAALAAKRRRGERVSRFAQYGFRFAADGRTVEPEASEQAIVRMICAHRADGLSMRAIASALNDAGVRTRVGTLWRFEAVRVVIRRRLAA